MKQLELYPYTKAERRAWLDGYHAALETATPFAALCVYGIGCGFFGLLVGFFLARWMIHA